MAAVVGMIVRAEIVIRGLLVHNLKKEKAAEMERDRGEAFCWKLGFFFPFFFNLGFF